MLKTLCIKKKYFSILLIDYEYFYHYEGLINFTFLNYVLRYIDLKISMI